MIIADVYDLLNDVFFEVVKFVVIAALIVLAIFLGAKLRQKKDAKKLNAVESQTSENIESEDSNNANSTM